MQDRLTEARLSKTDVLFDYALGALGKPKGLVAWWDSEAVLSHESQNDRS